GGGAGAGRRARAVAPPPPGARGGRAVARPGGPPPEPRVERGRLLTPHDAYARAGEGDQLSGEGRLDEAAARYVAAHERAPDSTELAFWAGLALVARGEAGRGLVPVRLAIRRHAGWARRLGRLDGAAPARGEGRRRVPRG